MMSATWTRPDVSVVAKGKRPSSTTDQPEEKLIQKIMGMKLGNGMSASSSATIHLEGKKSRTRICSGLPCYPAASPFRPAQLVRTQSWRSGPARGILAVVIQSAHGLEAADLEGTSDPYVILECGGQKDKSTVVEKTLDPDWNETFEFEGWLDDFVASGLLLRIFDWDDLGSADPLGEVKVSLVAFRDLGDTHTDYVEKLSRSGRMLFSVTWSRHSLSPSRSSPKCSMSEVAPRNNMDMEQTGGALSLSQGVLESASSAAHESLPVVPVMLPHKFDYIFLTYQRLPKPKGALEEAVSRGAALAQGNSKSRPASGAPIRLKRPVSGTSIVPTLRRPPSANIFEPRPFQTFQ
mmetsp:Transcript_10016/g.25945  ORF Transcript_10016/g.25945 Transcript_10016/m.25945 type:complete len:350 (-) Transcript_10016:367-1416(-)